MAISPGPLTLDNMTQPFIGYSGWASADEDNLSGSLMAKMLGAMRETIRYKSTIRDFFNGLDESWDGSAATLKFHVNGERDSSLHPTVPRGPIDEGNHPTPRRGLADLKVWVAPLSIDDVLAHMISGTSTKAMITDVAWQMRRLTEDFVEMKSRHLYNDGSGIICQVLDHDAGGSDGVAMTVDSTFFGWRGQKVVVVNSTYTTNRFEAYIVDVGGDSATFSISATKDGTAGAGIPATLADNDYLCIKHAQALGGSRTRRMLSGFDVLVDDQSVTASYQGIDRTKNRFWNAYRSQLNRKLDSLDVSRVDNIIRGRGAAFGDRVAYCNPHMITEYGDEFQPLVEVKMGGRIMSGFADVGFKTPSGELPVRVDHSCPIDRLYILTRSSFRYAAAIKMGFRPVNRGSGWGAANTQAVFLSESDRLQSNTAIWEAGEFICTEPQANALLEDITVSQGYYDLG